MRLLNPSNNANARQAAEKILIPGTFVFEAEASGQILLKGTNNRDLFPGVTDNTNRIMFNIGDIWLTAQYHGLKTMSKIMTLFLISYVLGMLVRYHPMQWTALIRGQIGDAALPTLMSAVEMIEQGFPQLVLDFLRPPPKA